MKQLSFLMVVIILSLFSCKKDTKPENNTVSATDEVTAASENALATNMFDDVYRQLTTHRQLLKILAAVQNL